MIEIDTGTQELLCRIEDRVGVITLNKPHKKNALGDILTPALRRTLVTLEGDNRVGCVMITGAGDSFCSGGDVGGMSGKDSDSAPESHQDAVAELRTAVENDPNNMALRDLLLKSYQREIALLKKMCDLPPDA